MTMTVTVSPSVSSSERENGTQVYTQQSAPSATIILLSLALLLPATLVIAVPYTILHTGFGYQVPNENVRSRVKP